MYYQVLYIYIYIYVLFIYCNIIKICTLLFVIENIFELYVFLKFNIYFMKYICIIICYKSLLLIIVFTFFR